MGTIVISKKSDQNFLPKLLTKSLKQYIMCRPTSIFCKIKSIYIVVYSMCLNQRWFLYIYHTGALSNLKLYEYFTTLHKVPKN